MSHLPRQYVNFIPQIPDPRQDTKILVSFLRDLADKITSSLEIAGLVNDRWTEQMVTLSIFKYIDIDSAFRNRNQYPLSSNFVIPYTNASPGSNALNSSDPVSLAYPYATGAVQAGSTITDVILSLTASDLDNFYIGSVLEINGQFVKVNSYNGTTHVAIISPALTIAPIIGDVYKLRKGIPITSGVFQAGSTANLVVLSNTMSSIDEYYVGTFLLVNSGSAAGQSRPIISYNGTTKQALLGTALSSIPNAGDAFEIDGFSYDNFTPMRYSGSRTLNQPVCYAIQLLSLTIPNLLLKVGYGGKINNYPYLYVHFYNETKHSETTLYGNNPAGNLATFRVSVGSVAAAAANQSNPNFFVFTNIDLTAPQSIKFSPSENVRFRVTLPSGENIEFVEPDTTSPAPPNPLVQISAVIGLKRIVTPPKLGNVIE